MISNPLRALLTAYEFDSDRATPTVGDGAMPFSIQIHGIVDTPYFSASCRVRVFLAVPYGLTMMFLMPPTAERSWSPGASCPPVPFIDSIQSDASECCAPWFDPDAFYFNDAPELRSHTTGDPISQKWSATVVGLLFVDMIDRRTRRSLGTVGHCSFPLLHRNGAYAVSLDRGGDGVTAKVDRTQAKLPLTSVVIEVHHGPETSRDAKNLGVMKLKSITFGAIAVEPHCVSAPCRSRAEEDSREDRRRLLYKNSAYRTSKPPDINCGKEAALAMFSQYDSERMKVEGNPSGVPLRLSLIDSMGFMVFNGSRGLAFTLHEMCRVEPFPCEGTRLAVGHGGGGKLKRSVTVPAPSLATLALYRVVIDANDVVVGQSVHHDWCAPLVSPKFCNSRFIVSDDTMMDDAAEEEKDEEGTGESLSDEDSDDDIAHPNAALGGTVMPTNLVASGKRVSAPSFDDIGELRGVTVVVRIFAMVPNYQAIPHGASGQQSRAAPVVSSASLLSKLGYHSFEPLNSLHWQVTAVAWGVIDVVTPRQPFINTMTRKEIQLYRGMPTERVLRALKPLRTANPLSKITLESVLRDVGPDALGEPMEMSLVVSVADASHRPSGEAPTSTKNDSAAALPNSLLRALLGSSPICTTAQLEEMLEATFRAAVFE